MSSFRKQGYTTQQVCEKLDISKKTLFNWEKSGRIPKINRDWRSWRIFTEEDLEMIKNVRDESRFK